MKKMLLLVAALHATLLQALPAHVVKKTHKKVAKKEAIPCFLACDVAVFDIKAGVFTLDKNEQVELLADYHIKTAKVEDPYILIKALCDDVAKDTGSPVTAICLAIPGLMRDGLFLHPHFPWNTSSDVSRHSDTAQRGLSHRNMIETTGISDVYFINDFQAAALGAAAMNKGQMTLVNVGKENPRKTKLIIGAGNGLGASLLVWDEALQDYVPMQLNYSFTEFAAQSPLELEFFEYLKKETGNIAWGKVLGSTGGIIVMYKFFQEKYKAAGKDTGKHATYNAADYQQVFQDRKKSQCAADAVDLYVNLYARWIRNAVYAQAPLGGVYVVNSVLQENQDLFATESFANKIMLLDNVVIEPGSKRYLENYLSEITLALVFNKNVALYGAAKLCVKPHLIRN